MEKDWKSETPKSMRKLAVAAGDVAGTVLVGMMLLTVYDIVVRSLGLGSVESVVELTTMGVVIIAAFGIGITTIKAGHVIIDVFTAKNKVSTNRKIDAFWLLAMSLFLIVIAYLAIKEGLLLHSYGTETEVLRWSVLTYYLPPVVGWAFASLVCFWIGLTVLFWKKNSDDDDRP